MCGIAYISYVPVLHCTHLGVQVPPSARADMEAFKEHSLYPHIHARQAKDYQACTYYLLPTCSHYTYCLESVPYPHTTHILPTCSHLLPRVLTHLLLTTMRTCTYSCILYSHSQTQADVSLTATYLLTYLSPGAYVPLATARWLPHTRVRRRRHRAGKLTTTAYLLTAYCSL